MDVASNFVCPKCGYPSSRSEICESCGALINRIRTRQSQTPLDSFTASSHHFDEPVQYSALSYEAPVSSNLLTKAVLLVALVVGGFFAFQFYKGRSAGIASASRSCYVHELGQSTFETEVLAAPANETWVVDFYANWCGPCKQFAPEFDAVAQKLGDKSSFARVNVDAAPEAAQRFGIRAIPTILMIRGGREVATTGGMNRDDFESWVSANL